MSLVYCICDRKRDSIFVYVLDLVVQEWWSVTYHFTIEIHAFSGDHLPSWRFCSQSMKYNYLGNSFWMYGLPTHKLPVEVEWNSLFFPLQPTQYLHDTTPNVIAIHHSSDVLLNRIWKYYTKSNITTSNYNKQNKKYTFSYKYVIYYVGQCIIKQ